MTRPLIIGGEHRRGVREGETRNPSDLSEVVTTYAMGGAREARDAVSAASDALPGWAAASPEKRHDVLMRAGLDIWDRRQELGRLLAREEGKLLAEGIGEVARAARILQFHAGEALRAGGERVASVRPGVEVDVRREPVGVVAAIAPWNFPIAIPAWKIAPALAHGCTLVLKPAEIVPSLAWELVDALHRAGLPAGVLNLVSGPGSEVGQALLDDPRVAAVTFTGSQATGERVAATCARHMRRVQLEMGGKNPLVVLDDADLDLAVDCALEGAFGSTGQRCTASSRLIVQRDIHDRFVEALASRLRAFRVGHALDGESRMGPVASEAQLESNLRYLDVARSEGGHLRTGGGTAQRPTRGHFMEPALVTETRPEMTINREEVFGPVASVIRVGSYDEALAVANDTPFGLSAGICTTSLRHASHFKANARAGMVMVNLPTAGVDYHVPFGGTKGSSLGPREQGRHAVEFFTTVKTAYTLP